MLRGGGQTQSLEQARQALCLRDTPHSGCLNFPCYSVLEMEIINNNNNNIKKQNSSKATKLVGGASSVALSFLSSYLQALGRQAGDMQSSLYQRVFFRSEKLKKEEHWLLLVSVSFVRMPELEGACSEGSLFLSLALGLPSIDRACKRVGRAVVIGTALCVSPLTYLPQGRQNIFITLSPRVEIFKGSAGGRPAFSPSFPHRSLSLAGHHKFSL